MTAGAEIIFIEVERIHFEGHFFAAVGADVFNDAVVVIVVIVFTAAMAVMMAAFAFFIIVIVLVIDITQRDGSVAMDAGGVVLVVAAGAEGMSIITHIVVEPEPVATVGADMRKFGQTFRAEFFALEFSAQFHRVFATAVATGKGFRFHNHSS